MNSLILSDLAIPMSNWTEVIVGQIQPLLTRPETIATPPDLCWIHNNNLPHEACAGLILVWRNACPATRIIVLSNQPALAEAQLVMRLGVAAYCHAYSDANVLGEVMQVVSHGGIWLGQEFLLKLIGVGTLVTHTHPDKVLTLLELLSERERAVARLVATAKSNKEIARKLDITERTVKAHLSAIFAKLKVQDRLQVALLLNERGLP
jgi:DNA-binding NarL/FixJ family response regulator